MTPYKRYLDDGILPLEPIEAKKIKKYSSKYTLIDGELFKHGFTHPILVCEWRPMRRNNGRTPQRDMRQSYQWSISSIEGHSCEILLANHKGRLYEVRTTVQAMSATR